MEILVSLLLLAVITVTIHQYLALALIGSEKAIADFQCMVGATNVMEMAMASSTVILEGMTALIGATAVDQWQPLPPDLVPTGIPGGFRAMVTRDQTTLFEGVTTTTAVIIVVADQLQGTARVQGYRDPVE